MTRVTLVAYDDAPPLGGQGTVVRGMRDALRARGHAVQTISGRGEHAIAYPAVTRRPPLDLSIHLNRHPALVTARGGDVIHAHGGPGGVLLLRDLGAPLVYTAHHTYAQAHPARSPRRWMAPLERVAYRRAGRVLAVSASTAQAVRALGVPWSRIEVLPPGVDLPDDGVHDGDGDLLLFAGRWEHEKGVIDALTVMQRVIEARPQTRALVVGSGSLEARVRELASSQPRIEVAGHVDERRLADAYRRAAVVVMPSRYEGLGLVALEAQAHGAAVVGYDIDGLRDAVPQRDLLVTPGDGGALVRLCLDLLGDPPRRRDAAARGRALVATAHSWEVVARRLEDVYTGLVSA